MKKFEDDLLNIIRNIEFKKVKCQFLSQLKQDAKTICSSDNIYVPADKTSNYYKVKKEQYNDLLRNNTTAKYQKTDKSKTTEINADAKTIADKLDLTDKIETLAEKPAFITIKDHKDNFTSRLQWSLINPSKSEIGIVSKQILDRINMDAIKHTSAIQWKNTGAVINWFNSIPNKQTVHSLHLT